MAAIPDVLAGRAVIGGDELVPFFDTRTQLLDQAAGMFSQLTNGYEFRVRYAFLTTWLRHYEVLPFALLIVLPTIFTIAYQAVVRFATDVFRSLSPVSISIAAAFPVTLVLLIAAYAKITHFYTLLLGLVMMTTAVLLWLHALLFATRWVRRIVLASVLVLLEPAVHYLVLFSVFLAVSSATLVIGEVVRWIRTGGPGRLRRRPRAASPRRRPSVVALRGRLAALGSSTLGRGVVAAALFALVTLLPYLLFVKFVALRGVTNLSETVPGDYYFIHDASVSWLHLLSWDLAGIMDKVFYGDYLAKVPRWRDASYSVVFLLPFVIRPLRRSLLRTRAHRQLFGVLAVVSAFAAWATIGYGEPLWFPTFHRSLAAVTRLLYSTDTPVGDLALTVSSTVVQVLRFPHRFQLLLFALAPLIMTLPLAAAIDAVWRRSTTRASEGRAAEGRSPARRRADAVIVRVAAGAAVGALFLTPFWSNANYRLVYGSGDFGAFLAPFPTGDLAALKRHLVALPSGKTVVLPPAETAKLVTDTNGVDHRFIDKFFIYYLDRPSFYYGLTGDTANKFAFFLILRGIYHQQDWWIDEARNIGVRYVVVNSRVRDNRGVGAEYLPHVEQYVGPALERQVALGFAVRRYRNSSYTLYELTDPAHRERQRLLIDSSWSGYLRLVWDRLALSRCYDLEYLPLGTATGRAPRLVYSDAPRGEVALDLWVASHRDAFFAPSSKLFAFDPNTVASSYYLSPMFREFLLFSNTKWNRTGMITPGVFGTAGGSFTAIPRPTGLSVPVRVERTGEYRLLLRGSVTGNRVTVRVSGAERSRPLTLKPTRSALQLFTRASVYSAKRVPVPVSGDPVAGASRAIADGAVPVDLRPEYQDLGPVHLTAGAHELRIAKQDANPMLVEGIAVVPARVAADVAVPRGTTVVDSAARLACSARYPVLSQNGSGYIDPAAHGPHKDLSNEELLSLAAAEAPGLTPPDAGGMSDDWIVLALTAALVGGAVLTIRRRLRPRSDESVSSEGTHDAER
ncbi:hypothetical protein [Amnibacterium kyonggiense]